MPGMESPPLPELRIGMGWDRHRLEAGRPCMLGGVLIPHPSGPAGHSDGDAVLHALADAVLGAAGLDDLGTLFPDTDPRWRGAPSSEFLRAAVAAARERGLRPASADVVVIADAPKLGPHRAALRASLAGLLGLPAARVNVKGKTTELGQADRIEAYAVVLLSGSPA